MRCSVCGGDRFTQRPILWDSLIKEWQLTPHEVQYVNRQQGETCETCGANLRSIALANAILAHLRLAPTLQQAPEQSDRIQLLEINEAGSLTKTLEQFSGYIFGAYPEVDIHQLPYSDASFDVVVHSDTLEHVANPVHALKECRQSSKRVAQISHSPHHRQSIEPGSLRATSELPWYSEPSGGRPVGAHRVRCGRMDVRNGGRIYRCVPTCLRLPRSDCHPRDKISACHGAES